MGLIGFERNATATIDQIAEPEARALLTEFVRTEARIKEISDQILVRAAELKTLRKERGELSHEAVTLNYEVDLLRLQQKDREDENRRRNRAIRSFVFERVAGGDGQASDSMPRAGYRPGSQAMATAGVSPARPRAR